jgi:hypothetical protein
MRLSHVRFILFRCRTIFHAEQATQSYPKAGGHIA